MKTISKPRNGPSPFRGKWESCVCHVTHTHTHISKPRNGPFPFQGKWESCVCQVTHTHMIVTTKGEWVFEPWLCSLKRVDNATEL